MGSKLLSLQDAKKQVALLKSQGKKIVFTNGCFDIVHAGHTQYLEDAKALGDILIVGLNSDLSVSGYKGPKRPIVPEADRAAVLSALSVVDMVVLFDDETPIPTIEVLQPDLHVKGGDYVKEDLPEYQTVKSYGGEVEILAFKPGSSTSSIIQTILERYR